MHMARSCLCCFRRSSSVPLLTTCPFSHVVYPLSRLLSCLLWSTCLCTSRRQSSLWVLPLEAEHICASHMRSLVVSLHVSRPGLQLLSDVTLFYSTREAVKRSVYIHFCTLSPCMQTHKYSAEFSLAKYYPA